MTTGFCNNTLRTYWLSFVQVVTLNKLYIVLYSSGFTRILIHALGVLISFCITIHLSRFQKSRTLTGADTKNYFFLFPCNDFGVEGRGPNVQHLVHLAIPTQGWGIKRRAVPGGCRPAIEINRSTRTGLPLYRHQVCNRCVDPIWQCQSLRSL
jgi:hypothetical protein